MIEQSEKIVSFLGSAFFRESLFALNFDQQISDIDKWLFLAKKFDDWLSDRELCPNPIPRRIHQIWIGSEIPKLYRGYCETWREKNPGWEYRLWDDAAIRDLGAFPSREAYIGSKSFGVKSDLARYEILSRFGGIYADTDFECLRPFDDIAERCSFFSATIYGNSPSIANGILGAAPSHTFIKRLSESVTRAVRSTELMDIINTTGPGAFTREYFQMAESLSPTDVIFPSKYFYPFPNFDTGEKTKLDVKAKYVTDFSYAIHYWEVSWSKVDLLSYLIRKKNRGIRKMKRIYKELWEKRGINCK